MENNTTILSDIEQEIELTPASTGTRIANGIIDLIGFYLTVFIVAMVIAVIQSASGEPVYASENQIGDTLLSFFIFILYYTLIEGATKGRTLGKLITGTIAVQENGQAIGWKEAFLRSISRIVPFEQLSLFFGTRPWHDAWTNTVVIRKRNP